MWNFLADYEDKFIQNLYYEDEDKLMIELIHKLRNKEYSSSVYALTSLFTFIITLQPEYNAPPTDRLWISFDNRTQDFLIGYSDQKMDLRRTYRCFEKQAESLVDAFVLRLFLTENNNLIQTEPEEKTAFKIGQSVETVIDEYVGKYRKGIIFKIEKHNKQNCFMYFIVVNGKKIKKRYFKDNLRIIE